MEIFVAKAGIESGPYTREQLPSMVESGMLALTDLVWHQGLPGWTPIHQYLGVRPPLPSPAAQDAKVIELPSHPGEPAHFGRRLGASAIDAVIWFVAGSFLSGMILTLLFGADYEQRMTPTEGTRLILIPACVLGWIYSAAMESGPWRATVGNLVFGLRVSDLDGGPISFFRACRRFSWKALMPMTLGLTLLPSLWTRRRQSVHGLLSKTLVLRK